ncbi:hypothetical protein HJFPF1_10654 [Paramyrothecium foliicola]|nr:hypothetical protein HJFPF1_10654 [Paramyrothecium foliicola]
MTLDEDFLGERSSLDEAGGLLGHRGADEGEARSPGTTARGRQPGANYIHTLIHVFVGAERYTCKFDTTTTEPTVSSFSPLRARASQERNGHLAAATRQVPEHFRGKFRPTFFKWFIELRIVDATGSTVWNEGEFPFMVDGVDYVNPMRLLVGKYFSQMMQDVDWMLDPGGILSVTSLIEFDWNKPLAGIWPTKASSQSRPPRPSGDNHRNTDAPRPRHQMGANEYHVCSARSRPAEAGQGGWQSYADMVRAQWLGGDEMIAAEAALLLLAQKPHREVVDGERSVDYSDEHMAQLK